MTNRDDTQRAIEVFKSGGIIIFPTDTVYGIGCRIDNEKAVKRLFEIRKRSENKPVLALVESINMAQEYLKPIQENVYSIMQKYWPGSLTIILSAKEEKVPFLVRGGGSTLGIRLPNYHLITNIIKEVGVPIIAPSANFAGEKTPTKFSEIDQKLISLVDYVLDEKTLGDKPSTIIDCSVIPWKLIRQGTIQVSI